MKYTIPSATGTLETRMSHYLVSVQELEGKDFTSIGHGIKNDQPVLLSLDIFSIARMKRVVTPLLNTLSQPYY